MAKTLGKDMSGMMKPGKGVSRPAAANAVKRQQEGQRRSALAKKIVGAVKATRRMSGY